MFLLLLLNDRQFFFEFGISQTDAHQEPVQLGFGQRESTFVLDGVLSGYDYEGMLQVVGYAVHGNLQLFHRFQQRRLGLGRRPVDLVGEDDLCHDGTRAKLEFPSRLVVNRDSSYVTGQQVRGELNTLKITAYGYGQAFGQHCFAHTRDIFNQDVPLGDQGCQCLLYHGPFANDHFGYIVDNSLCYSGMGRLF